MQESMQKRHTLQLEQKKMIRITGLLKLESFDKTTFTMETDCGPLVIKGHHLTLKTIELEAGILAIEGQIQRMSYGEIEQKKSSFWRNMLR